MVRKVNSSGIISTAAGEYGYYIYPGDGLPATGTPINPVRLAIDLSGQLVIADKLNYRVFRIDTSGIVHTIAGDGMTGYTGDNVAATATSLDYPSGVAFDACGNLYIPEANNKRIRKVAFNPTCTLKSLNVPKAAANTDVTVYPNPCESELNVNGVAANGKYVLLNITGIIEQTGTLKEGNNTIALATLPPGLYLLELVDEAGGKTVRKVIKQ